MRNRGVFLIVVLGALSLCLAACGTTVIPTPAGTSTPAPSSTNGNPTSYGGQAGAPGTTTTVTGLPDVADVVQRVAPGVVDILSTIQQRTFFGQLQTSTAEGSGVIFDKRGYILTNNHVVEGATKVEVQFTDGTSQTAHIVGTDPTDDLAVLKIDPSKVQNMVVLPLGNTEAMRPGDWVIAIGSPLGYTGSVTVGVVSALHRSLSIPASTDTQAESLSDLVQTDAVINPGNSGGPLLNLQGQVIGINTAIIAGQLPSGQQAEGLGFAISMSTAQPVAEQLIQYGKVERGVLGVEVDTTVLTPALAAEQGLSVDHGVIVQSVVNGGGAQQAGIKAGDIIVQLGNDPVNTFTDLQRLLLSKYKPGEKVAVKVVRGNSTLTFNVTLGSGS